MKVIGKLVFTAEAEGSEVGGKAMEGDYAPEILNLTMPLKTQVALLKDDAAVVVGLGGITTINFLHVKAVFADDYDESDATIELVVNDGSGEISFTGTEFMIVGADLTSLKLTNNSHDTSGVTATVFIELVGV